MFQLSHSNVMTRKNIALSIWTIVGKVMSLFFNLLSSFVITFLLRSKCLLISWLQSLSSLIFGAQVNKICHCFHCFPICCHEVMGPDAMILVFLMLSFQSTFSLSSFTFIKRLFSSSLSAIRVVSSAYLRLSPGNLDSSLCFIQSSISHAIITIEIIYRNYNRNLGLTIL